jgi:hypothetical protein
LPANVTQQADLDVAVSAARSTGWVQQLFDAIRQHVAHALAVYKNLDHVVALEICPKSFAENIGRVHVHVYLKSNVGKIWMPSLAKFRFRNCLPHQTTDVSPSRSRYTTGWAGFFYAQVPKKGEVFSVGSKDPFTGYPVQVNWVLTLVQAGKVSVTDARKLVTRCVLEPHEPWLSWLLWSRQPRRRPRTELG